MVVFFHATMFRPFSEFGFFLGRAGVDFFFMISGFVILLSAEKKLLQSDLLFHDLLGSILFIG